jgi:hypothetical protein
MITNNPNLAVACAAEQIILVKSVEIKARVHRDSLGHNADTCEPAEKYGFNKSIHFKKDRKSTCHHPPTSV